MRNAIVEGGIYFLLLFTPLAFGGVEGWALGVLEIVAAVILLAWAWDRGERDASAPPADAEISRRLRILWTAIALFVALVVLQILPLPPAVIRALSPRTHALYAMTIPGYDGSEGARRADLPAWLVARRPSRVAAADANSVAGAQEPPAGPAPAGDDLPGWRTLSIYPFATRQKLGLVLSLVAVFAVVLGHFRTIERVFRLLGVAVFCGFAVSLLGILQKFNWNGRLYWIREGEFSNPFGPFVDRNTYAAFAGTTLPIAIGLTFAARRRLAHGTVDALPQFLLSGFAAITTMAGILYSLSRGGMISTSLSMLLIAGLLATYGRHKREIAILALILALAGGFLLWIGPEHVLERVGTLKRGQSDPSIGGRMEAWTHAMRLIADHPVVGTGLGTFAFSFLRYAPPGGSWWDVAHNEYIELVCDTGVPGAVLALLGGGAWLFIVWRPGLFRDSPSRYAHAGILAGIAALLVHSCITSNLQVPANFLLLVVLGAALIRLVRLAAQHEAEREVAGEPGSRIRRGSRA
ncbi:MAG: O-antigen ligase family protein [Acidobacteria bacterium]|nr:O-antigen ligase family protein [Acidobacteriota bacterium]